MVRVRLPRGLPWCCGRGRFPCSSLRAVRLGLLLPLFGIPPLFCVPRRHLRGLSQRLFLHRLRRGHLRRGTRGNERRPVPSLRCGHF